MHLWWRRNVLQSENLSALLSGYSRGYQLSCCLLLSRCQIHCKSMLTVHAHTFCVYFTCCKGFWNERFSDGCITKKNDICRSSSPWWQTSSRRVSMTTPRWTPSSRGQETSRGPGPASSKESLTSLETWRCLENGWKVSFLWQHKDWNIPTHDVSQRHFFKHSLIVSKDKLLCYVTGTETILEVKLNDTIYDLCVLLSLLITSLTLTRP